MGEKIFGEIDIADLNELANNLRKTKEYDEIHLLCTENGISQDTAESFIKGDILYLAATDNNPLNSQTWELAREVLLQREGALRPEEMIKAGLLLQDKEPKQCYSVEAVKEKLEAELNIYKDGDSKYVVEKLIELCQSDQKLLECIMLPHKSYDKAFQYFYNKSRTVGYTMPHGNMVYLDNDKAVELSVEYFKKDDSAKVVPDKSMPAKKKEQSPKTKPVEKKIKKEEVQQEKPKEIAKPTRNPVPTKEPKIKKSEWEGQLSLFDL